MESMIVNTAAIRILFSIGVIAAVLVGCGKDRTSIRKERELSPVIHFVAKFIKENDRLPTDEEFRRIANDCGVTMVVLRRHDHPYAIKCGAEGKSDYMIGIWRGEWHHYYKSWDKKFVNASDEY